MSLDNALLILECSPMNTVLEILNAYAAIATITSFFLALWANHKNADEAGRRYEQSIVSPSACKSVGQG